ncbi:MAG: hypothetical protein WDN25_01635 [Acetobacteraceae bacterium]
MRTDDGLRPVVVIVVSAALLLWPALWNGYPLVFSDTGTYLSQAIERYLGWDRPVFYSLFLLPLHLTLTTWPVIAAQAVLAAHLLYLLLRTLVPAAAVGWLVPCTAAMAAGTALPWFVAQITPDIFTGLLVLALALLILTPERLSPRERLWLVALAALLIAAHQSHLPLGAAMLLILLPSRRWLGAASPARRADLGRAAAPLVLAVGALLAVNLLAFGRPSLSPYGNVFLLARVIYDGPGMAALRRDCPARDWRLCRFLEEFPPTSDDFLWRADGPVVRAGGAKLVSAEAGAIIHAALLAEPGTQAAAFLANSTAQLGRFATGDGLQAWPATVTPTILRHFPRSESDAYAASRQTRDVLLLPAWLLALHAGIALAGVAGCGAVVLAAPRRCVARGFAAAVLLALLVNAAVTGGLSGPHDRYQSRIMWLPPLVALLAAASLRR